MYIVSKRRLWPIMVRLFQKLHNYYDIELESPHSCLYVRVGIIIISYLS